MHAEQKKFLERRYAVTKWPARGGRGQRLLKSLDLKALEIPEWTLDRAKRDDRVRPRAIHSLWRRGESTHELLALDVFECESVQAAHDHLLELLGNLESGAVERKTEKTAPGDVAFGLGDTMVVFARANVVVMLRNGGPRVLPVNGVARKLDALLLRGAKSEPSR